MRIGLDVGGTKILAVAIDTDDRIVGQVRRATGWGADAVVASIVAAVTELCADVDVEVSALRSVGIGIPGQIDPSAGRVLHALNLGVDELDLFAALAPVIPVPVAVENDVKAAAVGAYALRGMEGAAPESLAYLNLGTGVAAGIVRDGDLWRGAHGAAGEIGHVSVDPTGPPCRCGQRGCIEALAGGGAVAERWGRPGDLPVRDIFDAADAGDASAVVLRAGICHGVAAAVQLLILTTDVDAVVLGGGITALGDRLLVPVRAELAERSAASTFLRSLRMDQRVALLPPGSPAAALGAALIGAAPAPEEVLIHG